MATQGTASIDFGADGKTDASVAVTGQAGFVAGTNLAEAWISPIASANNTADNHWVEILDKPQVIDQVTGTGFTIVLKCNQGRAFGQFNLNWVWN